MTVNRQVLIDSLPDGKLTTDNYRIEENAVPTPGDGEILCRTLVVTIAAGSRAGLQGSASYAAAPVTGNVMQAGAIARVEASNSGDVGVGQLVSCGAGWQDYSVQKADKVVLLPEIDDPAHYLGALGTNGLTAYFGLMDVGDPKEGETLLVSAAAGSVGHLVGQMGKIKGTRVVGIAGSDEKCQRLTSELGFDAAVNYKESGYRDALKESCPKGVDIYFDNVGGDILASAIRRMNTAGRISCCGVVSQYDTSNPDPSPKGIPGLLINKRLKMEGFLVFDYADQYQTARDDIRGWMDSGKLKALQDEFKGLESAPEAFVDLLAGGNIGTRIIRVAE